MGRIGKLSLKLIMKEKTRKKTFHYRKQSLMKKAYELSTLCDVRTCVLIYGPNLESQNNEVHMWPSNPNEIHDIIDASLKSRSKKKCFGLDDFLSERKKKIDVEILETKYPKWDEQLDYLSEHQLRLFMDGLDSKIDFAKKLIEQASIVEFGNSTFEHEIDQTLTMTQQNHLMEYSVPMDDDDDVLDLSNLLFSSNDIDQLQYNYDEYLQSFIFNNDPTNGIMESHNMSLSNMPQLY